MKTLDIVIALRNYIGMIVYHGTTQKSAQRIRREGFIPRRPSKRVWFARNRSYAQGRARHKARGMSDRPVVLTCDIDIEGLRQSFSGHRIMYNGNILSISATVPPSVLRSHPDMGPPYSAEEFIRLVNDALDIKPHKGPSKSHPGIQRLTRWVADRLANNAKARITQEELLALAQQWLPDYFEGREMDFAQLRARTKVPDVPATPTEISWEEEKEDTRETEALDCLASPKYKRRVRGLALLAELQDPDLFEWCAMHLEDVAPQVRVQALKLMRRCADVDAEFVEPLAEAEDKTVRAAAIEVLALHAGDEASRWFWCGVTDPSPHVRMTLARHLEELDPVAHRDIFESVLYDPHPDVARIGQKFAEGKGFAKLVW